MCFITGDKSMDKYEELRISLSKQTQGLVSKLQSINEITIPQSAFGNGSDLEAIKVLYISDMHIEAHMLSLGLAVSNKKMLTKYIEGLVNKMFDKQTIEVMTCRGVSPDNMAELINGYYYLFIDETRDMTKKDRDGLEWKLYKKETNIPVVPRLLSCLIIDGDLADTVETVELFFSCMQKKINSVKYRYNKCCPIYYVLGNHEYSEYNNVEEANVVYKERLQKYGVTVLNKEYIEYGNCMIFGGTGFAKNNPDYNSKNLVGPKEMNIDYEARESDKTYIEYKKALVEANDKNKPLIVISHYPLRDWMSSKTDEHCYYFTGHDHVNSISVINQSYIYADNQIGYDNPDMELKRALIGTSYNPFIDYEDGAHEITPRQYSDFYKYTGEYVGTGLIKRQLSKKAKLYLIKQNGFFGFFVVNDKNTKICAGGRVKVISEITDIRYFYECFCTMINQYVIALLPLRRYQEKLSDMIKSLNIPYPDSGRIHGCIVDVDFYHHIMINPYDGKNTFYYSPYFGLVQEFKTFGKLLESMENKDYQLKCDSKYLESKKRIASTGMLQKIETEKYEMETVDIKNSLYSVSQRVNQLQRLFTSNILREWDDSIIKNIVGTDAVIKMIPEKKTLSDYNLVQKSWMNLFKIPSEKITPTLVRCALDPKKKCFFPYTALSRYGYVDFQSKMSNKELQKYIEHIPEKLLKLFCAEFVDCLGITFFEVFPFNILNENEYDHVFSSFSASTKDLIEMISRMPENKLTDEFWKIIAKLVTVKNRPNYCSKELWKKIESYRTL